MATVRVHVLGCGDAFGSGGRFQTSFLLAAGQRRYLLDCGATTLIALRRGDHDPNAIEAIFLSHLHGDHFGGLPFFLLDAHFASKRTQPLAIAGPPGVERRVLAALEVLFPDAGSTPWRFPLTFVEWPAAGGSTSVAGVDILPLEVDHPAGAAAYALRLDLAGRTIAFSGDTSWTSALETIAQGADLFITECYAPDPGVQFHLDAKTLHRQRPRLGAKRCLLTHMSQTMLDRRGEIDPGAFELAEDGLVLDL